MSFPLKNGDFPSFFVCLPEGKPPISYGFPMVFLWCSCGQANAISPVGTVQLVRFRRVSAHHPGRSPGWAWASERRGLGGMSHEVSHVLWQFIWIYDIYIYMCMYVCMYVCMDHIGIIYGITILNHQPS